MRALGAGLALVVGLLLAAAAVQGQDRGAEARRAAVDGVCSWYYQLQRADIERLAALEADLIVVDYAHDGFRPLRPAEVQRLQRKPDGSRRRVLAYLSIGEAEDYRYYWDPAWQRSPPDWIVAENSEWPGNYLVRFWDERWKAIVHAAPGSYLERIQSAGFDGVWLDVVDAYARLRHERVDAREAMIAFVKEIAGAARARDPAFLVVPQNADDLLSDGSYRAVIDGIGRESLLYDPGRGRMREPASSASIERLGRLAREGKPVMAVEYITTPEELALALARLTELGFLPLFATRELDGRDPLARRQSNALPVPPAPSAGEPQRRVACAR